MKYAHGILQINISFLLNQGLHALVTKGQLISKANFELFI